MKCRPETSKCSFSPEHVFDLLPAVSVLASTTASASRISSKTVTKDRRTVPVCSPEEAKRDASLTSYRQSSLLDSSTASEQTGAVRLFLFAVFLIARHRAGHNSHNFAHRYAALGLSAQRAGRAA